MQLLTYFTIIHNLEMHKKSQIKPTKACSCTVKRCVNIRGAVTVARFCESDLFIFTHREMDNMYKEVADPRTECSPRK